MTISGSSTVMGLPLFCWLKIKDMDRVRVLILGLLSVVLLVGCTTTRYVPVPSVSVDSVYVDRFHRDSVYLHDSVFVNQYSKGDTVFVDKVVTKKGLGMVGEDENVLFSRARGDCCRAGVHRGVAGN